jgi:putative transposase
MKRRRWSSEEKMSIVLEGFKKNRSISEVCREHQISLALYYQWRDAFLWSKSRSSSKERDGNRDVEKKLADYERLVGE